MVASEAFDRDNSAGLKAVHGHQNGFVIAVKNFGSRSELVVWFTAGASYGLGVKTPVGRMAVLCAAIGIERPIRHGGIRAVVRQAANPRESRTTIGAIDVGVVIAV